MMDIVALCLSIAAFAFSLIQFYMERTRNRSEATIHAFDELEDSVFGTLDYQKMNIERTLTFHVMDAESTVKSTGENPLNKEWEQLTVYLARIEHFAVGVNSRVYDIGILRRMGKTYLKTQWNKLLPIIEQKRRENNTTVIYSEFERMIKSLD